MSEEKKDPMNELIKEIRNDLPPSALFEQLAEECTELAQCALKQARIMRRENPTDAELVDLVKATDEEVTDVLVCLNILGLRPNDNLMFAKMDRWATRLLQYKNAKAQQQQMQIVPEPEEEPIFKEIEFKNPEVADDE